MSDINVSFGANTAGVQQALALVKQTVNQTSVDMRQTFTTVNKSVTNVNTTLNATNNKFVTINKTVGETKTICEKLAVASSALRNSFRIATATVSTLARAASEPLKQFARYEDAATRLAPLVGSFEEAEALARDLRDAAANGTMDFERLTSVAGRLASVFKDRSDILKWTEAFHNLSAGTGFALAEVVFLLKLGGRRLKVMVMKKIFAFLLLICSTFALAGAKAPDSPVMRGGRFYKDECEKIWKECYGKISVTQNRSEARY